MRNYRQNYIQTFINKCATDANGVLNSEKAKKLKKYILIASGCGSVVFFIALAICFLFGRSFAGSSTWFVLVFLFFLGFTLSLQCFIFAIKVSVVSVAAKWLDTSLKCPVCGDVVEEGEKYCSKCGYKVDMLGKKICPDCGAENKIGDRFCTKCGKPLY